MPTPVGKAPAYPRHARRGRGPIAKRWIYWKRRFSNPRPKDWVLMACLLVVIAAAVCSFIDFRVGAIVLGCVPAVLAVLRALPGPWGENWANRSKGTDILTMLIFAVLLIGLAFVVPHSR